MSRSILSVRQWVFFAACLFFAVSMTGCSAFQTSHVVEPELPVSPLAVVSADDVFIPQAFSLVAADSIGLATFGYEISAWAEMGPADLVALQNRDPFESTLH